MIFIASPYSFDLRSENLHVSTVVQTILNARERNPRRWSGDTRDCSHIGVVTLNPERDSVVGAASDAEDILELVA